MRARRRRHSLASISHWRSVSRLTWIPCCARPKRSFVNICEHVMVSQPFTITSDKAGAAQKAVAVCSRNRRLPIQNRSQKALTGGRKLPRVAAGVKLLR